jgi:hypothetical protein
MFWALLLVGVVIFLLVGADDAPVRPDVLRERIEVHVADEERQDRAMERIDAFEEVLDEVVDEQMEMADALSEELEKNDASRAAIEKILIASDASQLKALEGLADLREELRTKKILTAEEWPKVFTIEAKSEGD